MLYLKIVENHFHKMCHKFLPNCAILADLFAIGKGCPPILLLLLLLLNETYYSGVKSKDC